MSHRTEIELDTFLPVGDAFLLVVAATCGRTLERVASRMGRDTRLADHAGEEETA